jgi:PAS domain S-box-containing protein
MPMRWPLPKLRSPAARLDPAAELDRLRRAEEAMRRAAFAVSTVEGEQVFRELVGSLAAILGTDLAFIALPDPDDPARLRMLAFYLDGRMIEDFSYALAGTPCETVLGQQYRMYPSDLAARFPLDRHFARLGLICYAGHPLSDFRGRALGLIAVVCRRPLADPDLVESMLKIYAARAVTEIERSRAEQALRAAEASYRAIFEAAEDPIFVHDWDTGAVLDANARASEVYGYGHDELLRISIDRISENVPPYTATEAAQWLERAKREGVAQFEWRRRSKDGTLHWDEVRLKRAVIDGQKRILAFTREITERKQAEEALRFSEAQYRAIFNASADALVLRDADFRIVDVNPTYEALTGYPRAEVLGADYIIANPPDVNERIKALHVRALAGEAVQLDTQMLRRDGTRLDLELRGRPIVHQGRAHVLYAGRDISARRKAERERAALEVQLRQAQKMEAIGHLAGGIAHDFNNILASVMGYTVLAIERAAESGDATLVRYLEQTERASRRARDLIQQMLTFSRGRRGESKRLALAPQVREALALLRSTLPTTIEVDAHLGDESLMVHADPVQCEQVLLNLCINARDAIDGPGTIRVTLGRRSLAGAVCTSCRKPAVGDFVELAVSDTGSGIPPAVLDRMFEPFFSTKEVGKGSGMGLATVHGIVHEHRGHVVVDSAPGKGATFRVLFPVLASDDCALAGEPGRDPAERDLQRYSGRVLVVDDERMVGEYMEELLTGWGLDVTVKADPDEAEAWYAHDPGRVDLVITDQTMPHRTGLALARRLTLDRPELPVLLYTGYDENLTPDALASAGVVAVLRKPVELGALRALLAQHLPRDPH